MKWDGRSYEIRSVNRRYRTPFRYTRIGIALQLIALWVIAFIVVLTLL